MKRIYSVCSKCLKVNAVPIFAECTIEEAKKELGTKDDPQIVGEAYVFPCIFCRKRTFILGLDGLKNREHIDAEGYKNVEHLYDYYKGENSDG